MVQKVENLIVGCGISGAVLARMLAEAGHMCAIIDKRPHIGGNCYDYKDVAGITVHPYGPHIFRTDDERVWRFLSRFTSWAPYMHRVKGYIDGKEIPIPFNLNSLHQTFPSAMAVRLEEKLIARFGLNTKVPILTLRETKDDDLHMLAEYIYEKVFLHYTLKQWGLDPKALDPAVTGRVPVSISRDDRYFQEKHQAIAADGYSKMFENMLAHPNISVRLNAGFSAVCGEYEYKRLFYTGPIDEYFNYRFGPLPYRSLTFDLKKFDMPVYQSAAVINYPNDYAYTRTTEYKYFLPVSSSQTLVAFEYPSEFELGKNERYYPIPSKSSADLHQQYLEAEKEAKDVTFFGRLGGYKYYDMQSSVKNALQLADNVLAS